MATTFGVIQKNLRENHQVGDKHGITQDDLVELLRKHGVKVSQGYLAKIETTKTEPRRDYVRAICEIFNIHPLHVLGMTTRPLPLTEDASMELTNALTPEGKEIAGIADRLPPEQRQILLRVSEAIRAASELEGEKGRLMEQWDQYWSLVEKLGGLTLRAKIERELGLSSGAADRSGRDDMLLDVSAKLTHDSSA